MRGDIIITCGYKAMYLECSQKLCWLRGVAVVGCPLGSITSSSMGSGPSLHARQDMFLLSRLYGQLDSCWLPSGHKCQYCIFRNFLSSGHCGSQVLQLGRTIDCFSPLAVYIAFSSTMRATLLCQFQFNSSKA